MNRLGARRHLLPFRPGGRSGKWVADAPKRRTVDADAAAGGTARHAAAAGQRSNRFADGVLAGFVISLELDVATV